MTVREMHLEVNQSLQQVAANRTRKYLSEEIDWVLNKIQARFVQQCLRPIRADTSGKYRFADQLRADALRSLIVYKTVTCYYKSLGVVQAALPADYQYLMTDVSEYYLKCTQTPTEVTTNEDYHVLRLNKTSAPTAPYYVTGTFQIGGTVLSLPGSLSNFSNYTGFAAKEDVIFLKDWILSYLWRNGVEVYWEKYGSIFEPDCFIIPGPLPVPLTLSWDGVGVTQIVTKFQSRTRYTVTGTKQQIDNRLLSPYDVTSIYTPYYAPSSQTPASELVDNSLLVYHDVNTIVDGVFLSYVRKPQPISLSLGLNCEINPDFHQTICDMATEYIMKQVKDEGNGLKTQDNETRVIL